MHGDEALWRERWGSESKHHRRSIADGQWVPKETKQSQSAHRFGLWTCILVCWLVQDGKAACLAGQLRLPPPVVRRSSLAARQLELLAPARWPPGGARLNHTQPCPWYWFRTSGQRYLCFCCGRLLHPVAPFPSPVCLAGASFHARHAA